MYVYMYVNMVKLLFEFWQIFWLKPLFDIINNNKCDLQHNNINVNIIIVTSKFVFT